MRRFSTLISGNGDRDDPGVDDSLNGLDQGGRNSPGLHARKLPTVDVAGAQRPGQNP